MACSVIDCPSREQVTHTHTEPEGYTTALSFTVNQPLPGWAFRPQLWATSTCHHCSRGPLEMIPLSCGSLPCLSRPVSPGPLCLGTPLFISPDSGVGLKLAVPSGSPLRGHRPRVGNRDSRSAGSVTQPTPAFSRHISMGWDAGSGGPLSLPWINSSFGDRGLGKGPVPREGPVSGGE